MIVSILPITHHFATHFLNLTRLAIQFSVETNEHGGRETHGQHDRACIPLKSEAVNMDFAHMA